MQKTSLREDALLNYLKQQGKLRISEIADYFEISQPTARRMCSLLTEQGKALRSHGYLHFSSENLGNYSFDDTKLESQEEKARIANYASTLVENGHIIFLEAGSTIQQFAIAIADRIKNHQLMNIIVYTNSLINLNILSPVCKVNLVGGLFRIERQDFTGYISEKTIKNMRFDYSFIGSDGLNTTDGIMASDIDTVRFDELLISRSDKSVILSNSSKFYKHSLLSYASVDNVSMIITDSGLSSDVARKFYSLGINLVCV